MTNQTDMLAEVRDEQERIDAISPQPGPCPRWCVMLDGHDFESYDHSETRFYRYHSAQAGQASVSIAAEEVAARVSEGVSPSQTLRHLSPPKINLSHADGVEELTAQEARQRAAELIDRAGQLESILARQTYGLRGPQFVAEENAVADGGKA